MDRERTVDRAALLVFVAVSVLGLVVFRIAVGWSVTEPYLEGTIVEVVPPTVWISVVPVFVLVGALAALLLYRLSGVRMPGSRFR
ncbi:hypothetical protein KY092_15380 [Natronomonas gomsonensis]|jgi:hypothetical protein|uniref:hypothetical protein n=1 Tax=Natronomonas gomsonensis TaxID=1046043 RepID=UPI0020CA872F|nr:hypothetical protein [Natronomonas gomsonensis]MCY4731942.1 hypothetical protein [Natronomonas gomsonensis]